MLSINWDSFNPRSSHYTLFDREKELERKFGYFAISPKSSFENQEKDYNSSWDDAGNLGDSYINLTELVSDEFIVDYESDCFFNDNGVVVGAYQMTEEEYNDNKEKILANFTCYKSDYKFELIKGEFPVGINKGLYLCVPIKDMAIKSNYVLYITNVKDFVQERKKELVK